MEISSVAIPFFLLLLAFGITVIILLFLILKKIDKKRFRPPMPPRDPKTFIRSIAFDGTTKRWQITCRDMSSARSGNLPPIEKCPGEDGSPAPRLVVRAEDKVIFDFRDVSLPAGFTHVEIQFPEQDLFVEQGSGIDDYIFRVNKSDPLVLTVKGRTARYAESTSNSTEFVFAMYVVGSDPGAIESETQYVQEVSPPRIRIEHD